MKHRLQTVLVHYIIMGLDREHQKTLKRQKRQCWDFLHTHTPQTGSILFSEPHNISEAKYIKQKNIQIRNKPGVTEVRAVSRGTFPPSVFSVLLWSFRLQGINKYFNIKPWSIFTPCSTSHWIIIINYQKTAWQCITLTSTASDLTTTGLTSSLETSLSGVIPR